MASKKRYSENYDAMDTAELLLAFQEVNSCILSITIEGTQRSGRADLLMTTAASTTAPVDADRVQLACVKFNVRGKGYERLSAAITYALYQLDAELARTEFERVLPKA